MNPTGIYHRLPYPLKVAAATIWGGYLNWWRYSKHTEAAVDEALEKDTWHRERIEAWQEEKLAKLLSIAAAEVPYYSNYWQSQRRIGNRSSIEVLKNWPVLRKEIVRENPQLFKTQSRKLFYRDHTSGTTGSPLVLWQSRSTLQAWYSLFEARIRRWNDLNRSDRWGMLGGQLVTPFDRKDPPFWVWNQASRQLYLSAYHLSEDTASAYAEAMHKHRLVYLLGYPSALTALAEFALSKGISLPKLKCVISNAEPLFDYQRKIIAHAFQTRIVNTYGMSELVCAASECSSGSMHLWPEAGLVEILAEESDTAEPEGSSGRIIATGLLNQDMPLIRYDTGDLGALAHRDCPCGRQHPILGELVGRMDEMIITLDGRKIGRLDPVFKTDIPVREAQIIQEDLYSIKVLLVPGLGYDHDSLLQQRLRERVGDMKITIQQVREIPRGANGKFRAVISHVKEP